MAVRPSTKVRRIEPTGSEEASFLGWSALGGRVLFSTTAGVSEGTSGAAGSAAGSWDSCGAGVASSVSASTAYAGMPNSEKAKTTANAAERKRGLRFMFDFPFLASHYVGAGPSRVICCANDSIKVTETL